MLSMSKKILSVSCITIQLFAMQEKSLTTFPALLNLKEVQVNFDGTDFFFKRNDKKYILSHKLPKHNINTLIKKNSFNIEEFNSSSCILHAQAKLVGGGPIASEVIGQCFYWVTKGVGYALPFVAAAKILSNPAPATNVTENTTKTNSDVLLDAMRDAANTPPGQYMVNGGAQYCGEKLAERVANITPPNGVTVPVGGVRIGNAVASNVITNVIVDQVGPKESLRGVAIAAVTGVHVLQETEKKGEVAVTITTGYLVFVEKVSCGMYVAGKWIGNFLPW